MQTGPVTQGYFHYSNHFRGADLVQGTLGFDYDVAGGGAFRMGLEHGAYCLGCCWVMMGLLFYGGVMNPAWIGALALYVLLEKSAPTGHWIIKSVGGVLILAGLATLALALR